jgi:hypothetical protein
MNKLWFAVLVGVAVAAGSAGCRGLAPPNWFHPGPAEYQQSQAQRFDPYPESDVAPRIVGARPLEYENPRAEVLRVQPPLDPLRPRWLPWNWGR